MNFQQNKKKWISLLSLIAVILIIIASRVSILKSIGYYLVSDDRDYHSPVYAVLGGNSAERGRAASWIAQENPNSKFIVTGGNRPSQLAAIGIITTEATLTKNCMINLGVAPDRVMILEAGTSSKEEADLLLTHCKKEKINQITIVSGQYHLRRLRRTFEPLFQKEGIDVRFFGAYEKDFNPETWWKTESGLIYTNNEYLKILYYWLKY